MAKIEQELYISVESDKDFALLFSTFQFALTEAFGDNIFLNKPEEQNREIVVTIDEDQLDLLKTIVGLFVNVHIDGDDKDRFPSPKTALNYLQSKEKKTVSVKELEEQILNLITKSGETSNVYIKPFNALKRYLLREQKSEKINARFLKLLFIDDSEEILIVGPTRGIRQFGILSLKAVQRLIYFVITDGELLDNKDWYTKK